MLFTIVLLLPSLLFSGCKEGTLRDISGENANISTLIPPTDDFYPPLFEDPSEDLFEPDGTSEKQTEEPNGNEPVSADAPPAEDAPLAETAEPSPYDTYLAACANANVNVRSGAGTNFPILTLLKKGDSLPYLKSQGNWLAVQTQSGVGYIYSAYAYLAETSLAIENVIREGLKKIGTPYEWGAPRVLTGDGTLSPYFSGKSFDCSSFVQYCFYMGCGVKLGNYTGSQADHTVGKKITSYASLRRGDFYFTGTDKISHVVIYLGDGYLLQTYSANGGPVSVTTDERWRSKFISGRRPDLTVIEQYK